MTGDDDLAALFELVSLPGAGPRRVKWLIGDRAPAAAVAELRRGGLDGVGPHAPPGVDAATVRRWAASLGSVDGQGMVDRHRAAGVEILTPAHSRWPFIEDPDPPVMAFALGGLDLLGGGPRVGLVGTRRCTTVGRRIARTLGAEIGAAGVAVVSGLAAGIDAESHLGALAVDAPVIGVVACGLDRPYPKSNTALWHRVGEAGLLLSESPLGATPERWKFPARNRLIAALSDLVVVVESHDSGGALSTADEAALRGVPVGAVPGSVLSSASAGTNALLFDGAAPIRHSADILEALGLEAGGGSRPADDGLVLSEVESAIVAAAATGPVHLDQLLTDLGADRATVLDAGRRLVERQILTLDGSSLTLPAPSQRYRAPL